MQKTWQLCKDKRGSTLIEVIVSVLIVGIVFVPLMIGLNAALNVNKQNEKELYAENVATNVLEVCKTYGETEMKTMTTARIGSIFGGAAFEKSGSTYTIKNIKAGTSRVFSADITFSTAGYDAATPTPTPEGFTGPVVTQGPKQNDFSNYASLSSIANAVTANYANDNLDTIVDHFWSLTHDSSDAASEAHLKGLMKTYLSQWLVRNMEIKIAQVTEEETTKYVVTKKIVYTCDKMAQVGPEGGKESIFKTTITSVTPLETQVEPDATPLGKYSTRPGTFILTYNPLKDSSGNPVPILSDTITIDKMINGDLSVYCLCAGASTLDSSFCTNISVDSSTDTGAGTETDPYKIHVYNNKAGVGSTGYEVLTKFGGDATGLQSKMKDVTVVVKDESGTELIRKTSTVIDFE